MSISTCPLKSVKGVILDTRSIRPHMLARKWIKFTSPTLLPPIYSSIMLNSIWIIKVRFLGNMKGHNCVLSAISLLAHLKGASGVVDTLEIILMSVNRSVLIVGELLTTLLWPASPIVILIYYLAPSFSNPDAYGRILNWMTYVAGQEANPCPVATPFFDRASQKCV